MVAAFRKISACGLIGRPQDTWLDWFAALGAHGRAAEPLLLALVEDADERVRVRRRALAALDAIGSPLAASERLRAIRQALERKREMGERRWSADEQIPFRPPPPAATPEVDLCRGEAGLPPLSPPPGPPASPDGGYRTMDYGFGQCVRERTCGPDEKAYRRTMSRCCALYGAAPPWFCKAGVSGGTDPK